MTAAVILLWTSCLWSIVRSVLRFLWTASAGQQAAALALIALTLSCCHEPRKKGENLQ